MVTTFLLSQIGYFIKLHSRTKCVNQVSVARLTYGTIIINKKSGFKIFMKLQYCG